MDVKIFISRLSKLDFRYFSKLLPFSEFSYRIPLYWYYFAYSKSLIQDSVFNSSLSKSF